MTTATRPESGVGSRFSRTDLPSTTPILGLEVNTGVTVSGNQVVVFRGSANGDLTPAGMVSTGGNGTGTGLGSGHGLVTTENGRYVIAVNAGSNSVSLLRNGSVSVPEGAIGAAAK